MFKLTNKSSKSNKDRYIEQPKRVLKNVRVTIIIDHSAENKHGESILHTISNTSQCPQEHQNLVCAICKSEHSSFVLCHYFSA
ncbi:hypothetical protein LINPERHAP1_LOCUS26393 [Linum perenne]